MGGVSPRRGDVWYADFDPVTGHEQGGRRPALIVSDDDLNDGPAELVIALPITTTDRSIIWHVAANPPEAGLQRRSFIKCEDIRAISKLRLAGRLGTVSPATMRQVELILRALLEL